MDQCLKITFFVGALRGFLHKFVQESAKKLELEGVAQLLSDEQVKIIVCGSKENIDEFIDVLYNGTSKFKLDNIEVEPFMRERDYRGIFRVVAQ